MVMAVGTHLGPYEILSPIGAGGMGEVYKARDTRLDRVVAVKVLTERLTGDASALARFEREAKAVAALSHPNILALYDFGHEGEITYAVMELLEGETLRERLTHGALPASKAADISSQIAKGLAAAHEKGILHRDLKPANVFLTKGGHVKILDFGLAKVEAPTAALVEGVSQEVTAEMGTSPGAVMGTIGYMAPEQARGLPSDARSDIFAFGVVLYEMLAGRRAFAGDTASDVLVALLSKDPDPLPSVTPPGLYRVVRRCLEKRPEDRFSSAHDLVFALEAVSGSAAPVSTPAASVPAAVASVPPPTAPTSDGWLGRHWVKLFAGVAAVALIALVAGWAVWFGRGQPAPPDASVAPSLVALPCKVLGSPESAYLTDAIPSTISTLLGEVQGLDTKVPPSSFEVEKVQGDLDKIAEAYGVQTFVLSTVTAEGDHFAVNIQVADARTRRIRWSHTYQATQESFTAMAREAAQGICKALLPEAAPVVPVSGLPSNSEADLAFQQGMYYFRRYGSHSDLADYRRSREAFRRALELNPKDARTTAWMSTCFRDSSALVPYWTPQDQAERDAWIQKALALDPQCSDAWAWRALYEAGDPNANMAHQIEWSLKAVQLAPKSSVAQDVFATMGLAAGGSVWLTVGAYRDLVTNDPLFVDGYHTLSAILLWQGRSEEALRVVDKALSIDPGHQMGLGIKACVLAEMGRRKETGALVKRLEAEVPPEDFYGQFAWFARTIMAMDEGDDRQVQEAMGQIKKKFADPAWTWNYLQWDIGMLLPAVNRRLGKDAALDFLILSTDRGAYLPYDMLMLRPDLKELRADPRAKDAIRKTKAPFDLLIRILRDARAKGELPKYLEKPMDDLLRQLEAQGAWP